MELLQDGVIAALSAIGLAAIVWCIVSIMIQRCEKTAAVLCVSGDAAYLEQTVRALRRWCRTVPIVIIDEGLDAPARAAAELLCKKDERIRICSGENLVGELKNFDGDANYN